MKDNNTIEWVEIAQIISKHYGEWNDIAQINSDRFTKGDESQMMPSTALLGNGDVGVVSGYNNGMKEFYISKIDFWSAGNLAGDYVVNDGGKRATSTKHIALGGFRIGALEKSSNTQNLINFYEKQDILNAEVITHISIGNAPFEMKTIVAATTNIVITEIKSVGKKAVTLVVETWAKSDNISYPVTVNKKDDITIVTRSTINLAKNNKKSWTSKAAIATKIVGGYNSLTIESAERGVCKQSVSIEPNQTIYIITAVGGGGRTYNNADELIKEEPCEQAVALLDKASDSTDIVTIKALHLNWWKEFWSASCISIANNNNELETIERFYYGAQYMLGCTVREGKLAPGLYGIWRTNDNPSWSGDYHLNYNFNATFHGTASSNRAELLLTAIGILEDYMEEGGERAGNIEEIKRINPQYVERRIAEGTLPADGFKNTHLYPLGIGPWGSTTDDVLLNESVAATYSAYPFFTYYNYTLDNEALPKAYNYLKKCVTFYEVWLEKDFNGYNLFAGYNEGSWAKNPTIELGSIKGAFENAIRMSKILKIDEKRCKNWEELYKNLAPFPTAMLDGKKIFALSDGVFDPELCACNVVALDMIIPGEQIGYFSDDDELECVINTLDVYGKQVWSQVNNFSRVFTDAVRVKYPIQKLICEMSEVITAQSQRNLSINDKVHGVEKLGAIEAINNMLLVSDKNIIKVFPNWLKDKSAKFMKLREKGAFLISSEYDGELCEVKYVDIFSEKENVINIVSPWLEGSVLYEYSDISIVLEYETSVKCNENVVSFSTKAGVKYKLIKA